VRTRPFVAGLCLIAALVVGCAFTGPTGSPVEARADDLMAQARVLEPVITALLLDVAEEVGGELVGLEHRLKTRQSIVERITIELAHEPGLTADEVRLKDALRYTVEVADAPVGAHLRAVRWTLDRLTAAGYRVELVKNYWPGGDTYSGINSILLTPSGQFFEVQFHTPLSFLTKMETHGAYEEYRRLDTPLERKREIFEETAALYNDIPIPGGILVFGSVRTKPAPGGVSR
jgi:hypothetical protein